jgi:hypothetical protein
VIRNKNKINNFITHVYFMAMAIASQITKHKISDSKKEQWRGEEKWAGGNLGKFHSKIKKCAPIN